VSTAKHQPPEENQSCTFHKIPNKLNQ
jgi:hypothetical protein